MIPRDFPLKRCRKMEGLFSVDISSTRDSRRFLPLRRLPFRNTFYQVQSSRYLQPQYIWRN